MVVTAEMMDKSGNILVDGGEWDKIVVSKDVDAKKITFRSVTAKELVVESGSECVVQVDDGSIATVNVTPPQIEIIGYEEIVKMLADGMDASEVAALYRNNVEERARLEGLQPTLVTSGNAAIESVQVSGSAVLNLSAEQVKEVKINGDGTQNRMVVDIKGYDGAVSVEQTEKEATVYSLLNIKLEDSNLTSLTVSGAEKSACYIEGGKAANIQAMNVTGAGSITMNVPTEEVKVDEKAANASVRIYSKVQNVVVEGDNNNLSVAASAKVENAVVEGDNVKVSVSGTVNSSTITGSGSEVSRVPVSGDSSSSSGSSNKPVVTPTPPAPKEYDIFIYVENSDGTVIIEGVTNEARVEFKDGTRTVIEVPAEIDGKKVTEIASRAFSNLNASELTLPEGLKTIGEGAFCWMQELTSVTIPASVESIEGAPLYMDQSLTEIVVAEGNKNYCTVDGVLYNKEMERLIQVPAGLNFTRFDVPEGVRIIGTHAFMGGSVAELNISESVVSIENAAFSMMWLGEVSISAGVRSIHEDTFRYSTIGSFEIDSENTRYSSENGVWYDKGQQMLIMLVAMHDTEFMVPDTVRRIESGAFFDLWNLDRLTIPATVTSIDENAFYNTYPVLVVEKNSYAERFAIDNKFIVEYLNASGDDTTGSASGSALKISR